MPATSPFDDRLTALLQHLDPTALHDALLPTGGVLTVMFTDIVNSTAIKAAMGDEAFFRGVLETHNRLVREQIAQYDGRELKTIGDAFLVAFWSPDQAVTCASEIQVRLRGSPILTTGGQRLQVRIGIHTGEPKVYRDPVSGRIDLFGTDVDKAARVEGLAQGDQILVSEQTRVLVRSVSVHDWQDYELKGLGRHRIFEVLYPGKAPQRPSGRPWIRPVRYLTQFVGRQIELSRAMHAVLHHPGRLVTLRGMGGIGKSRLADEVAVRVSQAFDDDVVFIDLAAVPDSAQAVAAELVARLGVKLRTASEEALLTELQSRRMLLVLETFEAVMTAAPLMGRLLRGCPDLHLLVTSQSLLGVDGEQQIEVLAMPHPESTPDFPVDQLRCLDSFQLFRDRARLRRPDWDIGAQEAPLVAAIINATDGIPLAIELAAAWVDQVTLDMLKNGLQERQAEYLRRSGPTIEERRHASMRACIDWSYSLLGREEQELFPQLAVFHGGFFAEDVAAVCQVGAAASVLQSLAAQSLIFWQDRRGKTRYGMLPTVRQVALEKLGDKRPALQRRHANHYLSLLALADDAIRSERQAIAIGQVSDELENFRAGSKTVHKIKDHLGAAQYALGLAEYLSITSRFSELLLRCQQGLVAGQALGAPNIIAACQTSLGTAYAQLPTGNRTENLQRAIACYEAALQFHTLPEFPAEWAGIQINLGTAYSDLPTGNRTENLQRAIACFEPVLQIYPESTREWAMVQNNLGTAYMALPVGDRTKNLVKAISCFEASLRIFSRLNLRAQWAGAQLNLGNAYFEFPIGDPGVNLRRSIGCYEAALQVYSERDFPVQWATTQNNVGIAYQALPTGDRGANLQRAIRCYEAALRVRTERDFPAQWAMTQLNLGAAYKNLPTGDQKASLAKAIAHFEAAITGFEKADLREEADQARKRLREIKDGKVQG
jgi:predicted ATPase/class 3 adenylate cyclase